MLFSIKTFLFFSLQLDFKVGWKKLKEVFSIAGNVKRADIKEDKDGKSRGMGTVTFEQAIEAVQAICILLCFNVIWIIRVLWCVRYANVSPKITSSYC